MAAKKPKKVETKEEMIAELDAAIEDACGQGLIHSVADRKTFVPHPLTHREPKESDILLADLKREWETLEQYIRDSKNPRWAATHLVRSIAKGLYHIDMATSDQLREIANQLATRKTT
jgi:hypothetical protein